MPIAADRRRADFGLSATGRRAQGQEIGAVLSSSVVLIRPDSAVIDPWYLAGLLSSSDSGRQATRMASTLGHDEGNALIRDLIDATVSSISADPELPALAPA